MVAGNRLECKHGRIGNGQSNRNDDLYYHRNCDRWVYGYGNFNGYCCNKSNSYRSFGYDLRQ